MRKVILAVFSLSFLVLTSCNSSEKKSEEKEMISYGPGKVDVSEAISVKDLLAKMENTDAEKEFTFEADIAEVCSNAGCWISVKKPDGKTFMVRFKDHFTIPIDTKIGTHAYIHGTAFWDTIQVESLKHFAFDAGKSEVEIAKITEPQFEFSFEGDGITFEKPEVKK